MIRPAMLRLTLDAAATARRIMADPALHSRQHAQTLSDLVHYRLLPAFLRHNREPMLWPAYPLAVARMLSAPPSRHIAGEALTALSPRPGPAGSRRLRFQLALQHELDTLLAMQVQTIRSGRASRLVTVEGRIPEGGAILLTPHQSCIRLGFAALRERYRPLGLVAMWPLGAPAGEIPISQMRDLPLRWTAPLYQEIFGPNLLRPKQVNAAAPHFLRDGGYLVITPDAYQPHWPVDSVLGRLTSIPPGATWLSTESGKPIVPYFLVPDGLRWRLVIEDPIEPTVPAIAAALERAIRAAPESWTLIKWKSWLESPPGPANQP